MFSNIGVSTAIGWLLASPALGVAIQQEHQSLTNKTHCDHKLCTWWHNNGEINTYSRVELSNVRQSRKYLVQVAKAGSNNFYDSFAYESIPQNGNGRIYSPWDAPYSNTMAGDTDDGISIELDAGINMAWSQFEYDTDVDVKISNRNGSPLGPPSSVKIRPQSIRYKIDRSNDGGIVVHVPKDPNGRKFSVEFNSDLFTYRSNGQEYVLSGGEVVGVEPKNSLLIFASPFLPGNMVPSSKDKGTKVMTPGPINEGDWGSSRVLYFPAGVYWMNSNAQGDTPRVGENHIRLHENTTWVYLAPGAYVKGAIEFSTQDDFISSGHGVLSGEHYVYQANVASYYQGLKSDQTSLRMWWHNNLGSNHQTWTAVGPTINAPPFNTMDFNGSPDIRGLISDYKQVGAFYFQTDGPEMYPNSVVHDVFYHVNDDGIKTYYSDVDINSVTIWKCHNDPIIQMGWDSRQVSGVSINNLNVIHARYIKAEMGVPSAIIGASPFYMDGKTPNLSMSIGMTVSNLVCEGPCPALLRINPLQNFKNFKVINAAFPDGLQTNSLGEGVSIVTAQPGVTFDVHISDWTVKGQKVTMENYGLGQLGQVNISSTFKGQWSIS